MKVQYNDLSNPLKVLIILCWIYLIPLALSFILGWIKGIMIKLFGGA